MLIVPKVFNDPNDFKVLKDFNDSPLKTQQAAESRQPVAIR